MGLARRSTAPRRGETVWRRSLRRGARHAGVALLFSLPAVVLWWHVWSGDPAATLTCACGDPAQEVWFLAWPAHALLHGANPFLATSVYPPGGANLLDNTSSPLVGLVLSPLTWAAGPTVSTNVALTLAPGLSAWGGWFAARRLVGPGAGSAPGAILAGLVFGYSPFVMGGLLFGHVWGILLLFPALMAVLLHSLLTGRARAPLRTGAALGGLAWAQFFVSSEVLVASVLGLVLATAAAAAVCPGDVRSAVRRVASGVAAAVVTAAVLLALPVWFALDGPRHYTGPSWTAIGLAGSRVSALFDPGAYGASTSLTQGGGYSGASGPPIDFVGVSGLVALAGCALLARRRRLTWVLVVVAVLAFVLSLGPVVFLTPEHVLWSVWTPWRVVQGLPVLDQVTSQRLFVIVTFCAAMLAALGVAAVANLSRWGWLTAVLDVAVAAALIVPVWWTYQVPLDARAVHEPVWFSAVGRRLPRGEVVMTYPFPVTADSHSGPMLWQAGATMRFTLAGGYVKVPGPRGRVEPAGAPGTAVNDLYRLSQTDSEELPKGSPREIGRLRAALRRWRVRRIVMTGGPFPAYASAYFTAATARRPALEQGAWVWTVSPTGAGSAVSAGDASLAFARCALVALGGPHPNGVRQSSRCVASGLT